MPRHANISTRTSDLDCSALFKVFLDLVSRRCLTVRAELPTPLVQIIDV
jgi:hypothetical protein